MSYPIEEEWEGIRKMFCAGKSVWDIANAFDVSTVAINGRAKKGKWKVKAVSGSKCEAAGSEEATTQNFTPPALKILKNSPISAENAENFKKTEESLLSLIEAPPEVFQAEFGKTMQRLIAEGLPNIEPPRNVNELKTIAALWSKASGLDAKASGPANTPLVNPLRTVTRRSSSVVVEVDEIGDFEV